MFRNVNSRSLLFSFTSAIFFGSVDTMSLRGVLQISIFVLHFSMYTVYTPFRISSAWIKETRLSKNTNFHLAASLWDYISIYTCCSLLKLPLFFVWWFSFLLFILFLLLYEPLKLPSFWIVLIEYFRPVVVYSSGSFGTWDVIDKDIQWD